MRLPKKHDSQAVDLPTASALHLKMLLQIAGKDEVDDLTQQCKEEFSKFPDPSEDEICLKHIRDAVSILSDECSEFPEHLLIELYSYLRSRIIMGRFLRKYIPDWNDIPEFQGHPIPPAHSHSKEEWSKRSKKVHWENL